MITTILVTVVISAITSVVVYLFMEAYFSRLSEGGVYETEFHEDETTHDVPEMDCEQDDGRRPAGWW